MLYNICLPVCLSIISFCVLTCAFLSLSFFGLAYLCECLNVPVCVVVNPRRACAARVTVVVLCVCECFRGPHLQLTQLSDKVGILSIVFASV